MRPGDVAAWLVICACSGFLLFWTLQAYEVLASEVRGHRSRRRQARRAATILAGTFVASCGHTVAIPADLPATLRCGACGTLYTRTFTREAATNPTTDLAAIRAFVERTKTTRPQEAPAVQTDRPREVYPTIGEDDDGSPDDVGAPVGFRETTDTDTDTADIEDVSDVV